jgi:hypothetical protein
VTFAAAEKMSGRSRDREGAVDIAMDRSLTFAAAQKMQMLILRHLPRIHRQHRAANVKERPVAH